MGKGLGVCGSSPPVLCPSCPGAAPAMESSSSPLDAEAVADLVLLDPLTEESLVQTLQERFRRQDIYVSSGTGGDWGG